MKFMNAVSRAPKHVAVLGLGVFGGPLLAYLQKVLHARGFDIHREKDPNVHHESEGRTDSMVSRVIRSEPDCVVLAVSPLHQQTHASLVVRSLLESPKDTVRSIVQINSVQSVTRDLLSNVFEEFRSRENPVVLISLHPNHGPAALTSDVEKIWILTDVTVVGGREDESENIKNCVKESLDFTVEKMREGHGENGKIRLIDLTAGCVIDGKFHEGPELHDFVAAYQQSVYHMVKIMPGVTGSDWFQEHFAHDLGTPELSLSIIHDNPFAKVLHQRFLRLTGGDSGLSSILKAASILLREGNEKIPETFKVLKTKNVKILENLVCAGTPSD